MKRLTLMALDFATASRDDTAKRSASMALLRPPSFFGRPRGLWAIPCCWTLFTMAVRSMFIALWMRMRSSTSTVPCLLDLSGVSGLVSQAFADSKSDSSLEMS